MQLWNVKKYYLILPLYILHQITCIVLYIYLIIQRKKKKKKDFSKIILNIIYFKYHFNFISF